MKKKARKSTAPLMEITPEMVKEVDARMEEFTANVIDMEMTPFIFEMQKKNVGELRVIRLYLEQKMAEVDAMCKAAQDATVRVSYSKEEAIQLTRLFVVLAKIEAKRGVIDYLLLSREIN